MTPDEYREEGARSAIEHIKAFVAEVEDGKYLELTDKEKDSKWKEVCVEALTAYKKI